MNKHHLLPILALTTMVTASTAAPMLAHSDRYYNDYRQASRTSPYVKKAVIGAGAGGLLGALVFNDRGAGSGAVKGALLGAGAGLGYEYLRQKGYIGGSRW